MSLIPSHAGTVNPASMAEGEALGDRLVAESASDQQDVPHLQPAADPANQAAGITGYKIADQALVARPLTDENRINALRSVVEARQGLQTFGGFTTADPYDEVMLLMRSVVNNEGIIPGVGKVYLPEDSPFWEYVARKKAMSFHDDYKKFIFSQIDLSSPERRAYWEARFPEYTNSLREGLRKQRALRARMEDIGMYGVQNETDMWLLYMKEKSMAENEKYMQFTVDGQYRGQTPMGSPMPEPTLPPFITRGLEYLQTIFNFGGELAKTPQGNTDLWLLNGP